MVFAIAALIGMAILVAVQIFWLRAFQFGSIPYIPTLAVIGLYLLKQAFEQRK
jgi:hypothetical protein